MGPSSLDLTEKAEITELEACYLRIEKLEASEAWLQAKLALVTDALQGFIFACNGDGPHHEVTAFPNFVLKAKRALATEPDVLAVKTVQYHKHAGSGRIDIHNDPQPHMGLPFATMILLELVEKGDSDETTNG